jgi:hypothetical protein
MRVGIACPHTFNNTAHRKTINTEMIYYKKKCLLTGFNIFSVLPRVLAFLPQYYISAALQKFVVMKPITIKQGP